MVAEVVITPAPPKPAERHVVVETHAKWPHDALMPAIKITLEIPGSDHREPTLRELTLEQTRQLFRDLETTLRRLDRLFPLLGED